MFLKNFYQISLVSFFLISSIIQAKDYVWGEEFKEGDVISAETFNQIFNTLEKLNRTPVDQDLLGTWSCDAVHSNINSNLDESGWTKKEFLLLLEDAQLTITASSEPTSLALPYTFSTSNPSPLIRMQPNTTSSGSYILFSNLLMMRGVISAAGISTYQVNIVSDDRFVLLPLSGEGNYPELIMCDSAVQVPAAPSSIEVINAQTSLNISWTDNSADETGFTIYRRLSNESESTELVTGVTTNSYSDNTLTEGQTAFYAISAYNDNGESKKTNSASATLDSILPTVLSTSPEDGASTDNTTVSITFSEPIVYTCPTSPAGWGGMDCMDSDDKIVMLVGNTSAGPYSMGDRGWTGITLSKSNAFVDGANSTYTVTVQSDYVYDLNGNKMAEDYVFTFTDN